ncbi:KTSC domain-containing protein [Neorhizobium huautlense]|uniref:KTSC domain-containing protein n=1 Tax=Neorhizobium huautlense TaxID=67774 RepID=UPI000CF87FD4|nr:KTSC domain-containing protein [Neorhizobium huautlense]
MERQPVSSSSLASVGYDPGSETLEVEFVATGKVYEYYNVPQFIYERLVEASSIGQFFNAEIRNAYPCNPV